MAVIRAACPRLRVSGQGSAYTLKRAFYFFQTLNFCPPFSVPLRTWRCWIMAVACPLQSVQA